MNFALPRKMILKKQLKEIAEPLKMTAKDLMKLLCDVDVVKREEDGSLKIVPPAEQKDKEEYIYGSEAILALCEANGVELTALEEVNVPTSMLYECNPEAWYDICILYGKAERYAARVKRLMELHAPMVILKNEDRLLQEKVEMLENNNGMFERGKSGRSMRSLSDIGYSLLTGWCPEMQEEFECRDAEMQEERDRMNESSEEDCEDEQKEG